MILIIIVHDATDKEEFVTICCWWMELKQKEILIEFHYKLFGEMGPCLICTEAVPNYTLVVSIA